MKDVVRKGKITDAKKFPKYNELKWRSKTSIEDYQATAHVINVVKAKPARFRTKMTQKPEVEWSSVVRSRSSNTTVKQ